MVQARRSLFQLRCLEAQPKARLLRTRMLWPGGFISSGRNNEIAVMLSIITGARRSKINSQRRSGTRSWHVSMPMFAKPENKAG
jgi:hypothetical protein